jgi:hypothetical protein
VPGVAARAWAMSLASGRVKGLAMRLHMQALSSAQAPWPRCPFAAPHAPCASGGVAECGCRRWWADEVRLLQALNNVLASFIKAAKSRARLDMHVRFQRDADPHGVLSLPCGPRTPPPLPDGAAEPCVTSRPLELWRMEVEVVAGGSQVLALAATPVADVDEDCQDSLFGLVGGALL